jgi:hypothetical protein
MPIPLGFFATAGAGGAAASAFEQISTISGTGSSGTITFSSIPQTYRHLQIRLLTRCTNANIVNNIFVNYNSNFGASYDNQFLFGNTGNNFYSGRGNGDKIELPVASPGTSAPANYHSPVIMDIVDYSITTKNKTTKSFIGSPITNGFQISLNVGQFRSTAAISTITITVQNASFTSSSIIALYGIRG